MSMDAMNPIASVATSAVARRGTAGYCPHRPYIGVSVAVFRSGKVLLARRTRPPFTGGFSLPGGLVEAGETLEAAALRELREEVQVEARIVAFNRHVEFIARDDEGDIRHHFVIASFAGEWIAGEGKSGPEAAEIVWVEPGRVETFDCTPHIATVVESAAKLTGRSVDADRP